MATISVICAAPPGPNPGMSSVDLAFWGVCRRHHLDSKVRFLHLYGPEELHSNRGVEHVQRVQHRQKLPFEYAIFRDRLEEVYSSSAVVFWGDFLHAYDYYHSVGKILVQIGVAKDPQQAAQVINRHLFFSEAEDRVLRRCLIFGCTIVFNQANSYFDTSYLTNLTRLMKGSRRVWMRDVYSAMKVGHLREDYSKSSLGVDCSLLLRAEDLEALEAGPWSRHVPTAGGKVGVFFGRSSCDGKVLGKFVRDLCRKIGRSAQWLPWGDTLAFDDMQKRVRRGFRAMEVLDQKEAPTPGDLYALLRQYSLVVSDTYHVCVNAWRLGVPAICVAEAVSKTAWSVSSGRAFAWRDKRQIFYSMYDAMPFYTYYTEEISDRSWRERRLFQLTQVIADKRLVDFIVGRIHHHRDCAERELVGEIKQLLEPSPVGMTAAS